MSLIRLPLPVGRGERLVARSLLWLRADPEAIRELKCRLWLLQQQGVRVTFDPSSSWEVAVMPLAGSPEYALLAGAVDGRPKVFEPDPLRALLLALAYPSGSFSSLQVGVDPGRRACGVAAIADGLVFHASPSACGDVGREVSRIVRAAPSERYRVLLGSGTGWEEVAGSLLEAGLQFEVVDEYGTTSSRLELPVRLKDRNLRAALRLAMTPPLSF
ncbi:hypothetical protein [Acidilobus sp. 7A]|uniref:hypothetical protein n=1 Tax=Acidilobus sp. 7A TaxID=1577685 RepID=UPI000764EF47|nr:hypothetical protein [Acidilobus sp. 7A]AMD30694.1 hypothetical protein SE86_04530 [Acidilobus sp. 7A]